MFPSLKEALVYSVKDNTVERMTRGALVKREGMSIVFPISLFHHSGLTLTAKLETDFVSAPITIPKGAIRMDITSDDLRVESQVDEDVESPSSLVASIHIPSGVYWV